jgi:CheY-like chemotaxis protein
MAKLVVVTQELAGLSHELSEGWTTIGRADGNGFKLADTSVSGQHCEVRLQRDELLVRDLCSTNGTFFQGRRITETVLKAGQTLRVGEVVLRFEAAAVGVPPTASFVNTMLVKKGLPQTPEQATPGNRPQADKPGKKYQVLFVDDSLAFMETFSELCCVLAKESWQVHCATSADQALAVLQKYPIDLVVLDVVMPMVDGVQVLGLIKRRYPGVRVAVLTGKATEGSRAASLAGGAELFIEKPICPEGSQVVFNMLNDLVSWEHRDGFSGLLRQVGLQEVIQMECIGRRSSILEVRNPQMLGEIYIDTGVITHAAVGELVGSKAFNRLMSLNGGEFRMRPFEPPPQRTVDAPWEFLIMEAARCRDEDTSLIRRESADTEMTRKPAAPAPVTAKSTTSAAEKKYNEPDDEFVVVATYDGEWSAVDGASPLPA